MRAAIGALAGAVLLAGCALGRGEPPAAFDIRLDPPPAAAQRLPWQVAVEMPHATPPLSDDRVVVALADGELTVLPGVRWREHAPALVQSLLLEALDACACVAGAARDGGVLRADYVLAGELRHFELRDEGIEPPEAHVDLTFALVRRADGSVVAQRRFERSVAAERRDNAAGIAALGTALNGVLADALPWLVASLPAGESARD